MRFFRIGEDTGERLDIVPAQFRVLVVRRSTPGEVGRQDGEPPATLGGDGSADRPTFLRRTGAASRFSEEC
jgi:hypothetical protein